MTAVEDAGTGAQGTGRVSYHYRTLGWFGAISTTAAVLAAAVAAVTIVLAVFIGVAADFVRWMHDVVNLLDRLDDGTERE